MKIKRPRLKSDQENAEKAYQLLLNFLNENSDIEPTIWAGAVWGVLVNGYVNCNFTYKEFKDEMNVVLEHYEHWFDENGH